MARRRRKSRLSSREGKRYARQSLLFTILTVALLLALLFWGIPSLIKLAIFLGDLRSSTQPISGEDTIAPPPPILRSYDQATNSATIRLEGFAEEGSTVVLSMNGTDVYETLTEGDGEFLFDRVKLGFGENRFTARVVDPAGNESKPSLPLTVSFDNQAPPLTLERPSDGATFFGSSEKSILVEGSTEAGARVQVNGLFVIVSPDGNFTQTFSLGEGENTILVVAQDYAGNRSEASRTVTFEP